MVCVFVIGSNAVVMVCNFRFEVVHVLSEPDPDWTGLSGRITADVVSQTLPANLTHQDLVAVCGPSQFTQLAVK